MNSESHDIGITDAMIAATAQQEGLEIKTLNTRHYPMFRRLEPPYRKHKMS